MTYSCKYYDDTLKFSLISKAHSFKQKIKLRIDKPIVEVDS